MTHRTVLFIYGYRKGKFTPTDGKNAGTTQTFYSVDALRQPSARELEAGAVGLLPFGKTAEGNRTSRIKIPASNRDMFPSFDKLPGFYEFEFELEGSELVPVMATEYAPVVFPELR